MSGASHRPGSIVRAGAVALAAGLAVLLAGCGDGGEPESQPRSSPTPTQAQLPTPTQVPEGDTVEVGDLEVGDCFTEPNGDLIEEITKLPCGVPHDAEVYALPALPSSPTYPGDGVVEAQSRSACTDASDAVDEEKLPGSATIGFFFPTADNWSDNDNTVQCYIATNDEPLVGSVRQ